MMATNVIHIVIIILLARKTVNCVKMEKVVMPRVIRVCKDTPQLVATNSLSLDIVGNSLVAISVNLTIPREMMITSASWSQYKCRTPNADLSDCEFLLTFPLRRPCKLLSQPNQSWTSFVTAFQPKLECPLKKGLLFLDKVVLDSNAILKAFENNFKGDYFWMLHAESYLDKETIHCVECVFELITRKVE